MKTTKTRLNLVMARKRAGLSQLELAKIIGVTNQTISAYERGNTVPTFEKMKLLSQVLKTNVEELFFSE